MYVYQTQHKGGHKVINDVLNSVYGGGKVIGSFICDRIDEYEANERGWYIYPQDETCLWTDEIAHYGKGKTLYGWHITEPKLFDKPKELSDFYIPCKWYEKGDGCPEDCGFFKQDGIIDRTDDFCEGKRPITRPPQSWCYVEC